MLSNKGITAAEEAALGGGTISESDRLSWIDLNQSTQFLAASHGF